MDAASIEQMNKMRVSLGIAPLPVPGDGPQFKQKDDSDSGSESDHLSTLDKRQAAAGNNWQKLEDERKDKVERQKRKDAAKKARDAAQRDAKLEGKGLGDADDDEADTRTWLLQQKKRQKKIEKARKMAEELAAREQQAEYTSKDLAGVKVGHEVDQFDEITGEQILTLKDAEIGDESEDDELENADIKAKERLEDKLKLKKKRPDYDPTEQDEKQNMLSKYDEEIDGKKQKRFTLDGQGSTQAASREALDLDGQTKTKGVKISLDMLKDDTLISDYVDPSTVRVKKPKKKKEKKTRQKPVDEDDILAPPQPEAESKPNEDAMEIDGENGVSATNSKKRAFDFGDDDDLQAKLAEQRRQVLKKRKKMDAAELARQMREEMPVDEEEPEEGGMTIDETTEFVANLKKPEAPEPGERQISTPHPANAASPDSDDEDADGDTAMANQSYADIDDRPQRQRETSTPAAATGTATGLEDEENLNVGAARALGLLRKRGVVDTSADDKLAVSERARRKFIADKQHLFDDFDKRARQEREAERRKGTWDKMSNRDREAFQKQQNEARERYMHQLLNEEFKKNYKPNVELKYTDADGRQMNQKEAFKHMSHQFHGKGSGKQKTEKRMKKIGDEKKEAKRGLLNVGTDEGGMGVVQGREGKKTKQAGVRLQ